MIKDYFVEKQQFVFKLNGTDLSYHFFIKGIVPPWNRKIEFLKNLYTGATNIIIIRHSDGLCWKVVISSVFIGHVGFNFSCNIFNN